MNWSKPLPMPDAPAVIVIQSTLLIAVQVHMPPVRITSTFPLPPLESNKEYGGENVHVHGDAC